MKVFRVVAIASVFWIVAGISLYLGSGSAPAVLLGLAAMLVLV